MQSWQQKYASAYNVWKSSESFEFETKMATTPLLNLLQSSIRNYPPENLFEQNPRYYDAFEKDIALVEIFF